MAQGDADTGWSARRRGVELAEPVPRLSDDGAVSFLPYNAGGDGDNVWPFIERDDKFHYDLSKLDQWQIVFDHAQQNGIYLHFKLQEQEIDDNIRGTSTAPVRESLDGGDLGKPWVVTNDEQGPSTLGVPLKQGSIPAVNGGASVSLGTPPGSVDEDWLAVVRRAE